VKKGKGLIKVNGVPIELVQPETLRFKAPPSHPEPLAMHHIDAMHIFTKKQPQLGRNRPQGP
jgi:hypothetical protein